MKRAEFLKSLGVGSTSLLLPTHLLTSSKVKLYDNYVRGLSHYQWKSIKSELKIEDSLLLKRDLDNMHDRFAVEVYWNENKLGYLAAFENICIANLLDAGTQLYAAVSYVNTEKKDYKNVGIEIFVDLIKPTEKLLTELQNSRADEIIDLYRTGFDVK